jgi:hypothetical protein
MFAFGLVNFPKQQEEKALLFLRRVSTKNQANSKPRGDGGD